MHAKQTKNEISTALQVQCVRVFSDVIDGHLMKQFAHQIFLHRTYFRKMIINLLSYANTLFFTQ